MDILDSLLDAYYEKFGENYPISVVDDRDEEEVIADIRACILNGTPAKEPEYDAELKI